MKDNECVEVLPDGTIHYFDLDVCNREAVGLIEELGSKQGKVPNFDFNAAVFALFIHSLFILHESGWSADELADEVLNRLEEDEEDTDEDEA